MGLKDLLVKGTHGNGVCVTVGGVGVTGTVLGGTGGSWVFCSGRRTGIGLGTVEMICSCGGRE